jgi:hypothetical protein
MTDRSALHETYRLERTYPVPPAAAGALPIVAVLVLHASAFQVSLLSGLSGLTAAAIMLPLGARIEHRCTSGN